MRGYTAGELADFVVIDRDLTNADAEQLLNTHVLATYLGGTQIYDAASDRLM